MKIPELIDINLKYCYVDGNDKIIHGSAGSRQSGKTDDLSWDTAYDGKHLILTVESDKNIIFENVSASFGYHFEKTDRVFLNGYQSWTDSHEHTIMGRMHSLDRVPEAVLKAFDLKAYGDYDFVKYGKRRGQMHGFSYGYIRNGKDFCLTASADEKTGFTVIRYDTGKNTVVFEKDLDGIVLNGTRVVLDVFFETGGEEDVFDRYFEILGIKKCEKKTITGYTSWYNLYENISEESVMSDLEAFRNSEDHPDVFQIDDGYEAAVGDWLKVDPKKFPHGMKICADRITEEKMIPGIWLAPFAAKTDSDLSNGHSDWIVRDQNGNKVKGGSNWGGFYALDIYNEEFRAYLKKVFDTVIGEWGYKFLKLDFLYAACIIPRMGKSRGEIMNDAMELIREYCGDVTLLGCGVPLAPAFGKVDYCRIGCDVSLTWNDAPHMRLLHRERVSTKNTILNTVFRRQLDGRAFRCDPDVYVLREKNNKLKLEDKRALAFVNKMFGGVLFTSDNVAEYGENEKKIYSQMKALKREDFISADIDTAFNVVIKYRNGDDVSEIRVPLDNIRRSKKDR